MEEGRERGREGKRDGGREGGRERGMEGGREGERERGVELTNASLMSPSCFIPSPTSKRAIPNEGERKARGESHDIKIASPFIDR